MKPTITANLAGTEFIFETDAYALLEQYLRSLREAFDSRGLDTAELLGDIEARCAEILSEPRVDGSRIVTVIFVRDLIDRMGQPGEIFTEEAPAAPAAVPPPVRKRLYRDPQNKLLGGVCSGVAEYVGWDPVWVRLATVGLAILSFSTVTFVYIILWIILKPAVTPYQQMQLRGVSPTLQNIGQAVTGTFRSMRRSMTANSSPAAAAPLSQEVEEECVFERLDVPTAAKPSGARRFAQSVNKIASVVFKVLLGLFGLVSIPATIGMICALCVFVGMSPETISQIAMHLNNPVAVMMLTHHMDLIIWSTASSVIFFAVPSVAMIWMCYALLMGRRAREMGATLRISLLIIWVISIFSMMVCGSVIDIVCAL